MSLIKLNLCLKKHSCILTNNLSKSKTSKKYNLIADERIVILLHINEKSYQRVNILLLREVFSHGKVRLPESSRTAGLRGLRDMSNKESKASSSSQIKS